MSEENDYLERDVRSSLCQIGGTPLSFITLKKQRIGSELLIDWLIPFHLIEQYADYLNLSNPTSTDDTLICNCTAKRVGIACQYQIENKDWELSRLVEAQRSRQSNEYETLTSLIDGISCNGSVPRVEWRQICDGISQCEDASDELNCHLLELNQCNEEEDEEYRCRNGMCIPKEFAFDGTFDCMDSSDEQEILKLTRAFDPCPDQSLYRCDERLCRKDRFSCGDGQCVPWSYKNHRLHRCHNTTESVSLYRLNDGYRDCLYEDDERNVNDFLIQPFRYRCQTVSSPFQYVSYQQLGNGLEECLDGTDEISSSMRWSLLPCDAPESYACWIFRTNQYDLSSVALPYFRYCDTVWDILYGEDEKNCSQWICVKGDDQCQGTGQCLSKNDRCDGEFDCSDGEDELNCLFSTRQWTKERDCDLTNEMFCITGNYLEDPLSNRPCIPATHIGNDRMDCLGGRDERNTFACPDRQMLGDRFLCDQQTRCLDHSLICDGIIDCLDQTDEKICLGNRTQCSQGQFACVNRKPRCVKSRCDRAYECSDKSNWFWCPNSTFPSALNYRSTKNRFHIPKHSRSCLTDSNLPLISAVLRQSPVSSSFALRGYCNRGFYLIDSNHSTPHCFCPPSYYGDRCQYDRRRITVLVTFDRWHREDIPMIFTVLIVLIYNTTRIVDHQFFSDVASEFAEKHHYYLFYPRPRLPGVYSVRFEAYHSLQLLALWEYSLGSLDFLPRIFVETMARAM
ncbi:unnamed protein product [Adineta steineri]|uniref:EGF-like domain-containing protein n=1 Tax=Adineta steineri TaxID=433720 RepID=A0A813M610_9BILA|nr:unnamed protein product [Adineta steineri]